LDRAHVSLKEQVLLGDHGSQAPVVDYTLSRAASRSPRFPPGSAYRQVSTQLYRDRLQPVARRVVLCAEPDDATDLASRVLALGIVVLQLADRARGSPRVQ
jgi:hypothetical protein